MRSLTSLGLGLALMLALAPAAAAQDDPSLGAKRVNDPGRPDTFVGFYRIVSGEDDGEPLPAGRLMGHVVRITESMITVLDAEENALYACKYTLRPAEGERPARLDMETTGGPPDAAPSAAKGIIRKGTNDEGRPFVMLCYRSLGDEYPEEFRTRAESETNLFVLEPVPDPAANGAEPTRGNSPDDPPNITPNNPPIES